MLLRRYMGRGYEKNVLRERYDAPSRAETRTGISVDSTISQNRAAQSHARIMASSASRARQMWHVIDAKNRITGRLAVHVARLLMGKHKPTYRPNDAHAGDMVVVVNCKDLRFTGRKHREKIYRWHTGYPGGMKSTSPRQLIEFKKQPEQVLTRAVAGMLPRNRLRATRMGNLKAFGGPDHPFEQQVARKPGEYFGFWPR